MASENVPLYVEIPVELKEWLYAKAKEEDRKVTTVVQRIFKDEQRRATLHPLAKKGDTDGKRG